MQSVVLSLHNCFKPAWIAIYYFVLSMQSLNPARPCVAVTSLTRIKACLQCTSASMLANQNKVSRATYFVTKQRLCGNWNCCRCAHMFACSSVHGFCNQPTFCQSGDFVEASV